jgi:hypothetical protein
MAVFIPSPDLEREVAFAIQDAVAEQIGAPLAERAAELTPRGGSDGEHAADHFTVVASANGLVYVGNDLRDPSDGHFIYHLIEFGSVNNPAYGGLRAAANSLGLRLIESRES